MCLRLIVLLFWMPERWRSAHIETGGPRHPHAAPGRVFPNDRDARERIAEKRAEYAKEWAAQAQTVIVLKGNQTVIAFPDGDCWLNPTGNGALAKGGTGDTLTGMILGMLSCHEDQSTPY